MYGGHVSTLQNATPKHQMFYASIAIKWGLMEVQVRHFPPFNENTCKPLLYIVEIASN